MLVDEQTQQQHASQSGNTERMNKEHTHDFDWKISILTGKSLYCIIYMYKEVVTELYFKSIV